MKDLASLLTLPGSGVYTVHTGKEKKENIQKAYYGTSNSDHAQKLWLKELNNFSHTSLPVFIGLPSDNGGGIHRGANWGPLAIREALLDGQKSFYDIGDIKVIPHLLHDKYLSPKTIKECQLALYQKKNKLPVSPLSIAEAALKILYKNNHGVKIFGVGGDHSNSYPLVKTWIKTRKDKRKIGLLHFDAHTDLSASRLGIDLCFGTWTYHILKEFSSPDQILQVGIRSSGKTKSYWKKSLGVHQIWSSDVRALGLEKTYLKIKKHFNDRNIEELYISFDIDALDAKYACATGTPEEDGLIPSEASLLIKMLSRDFIITGADLMELAPYVWPHGAKSIDQQNSVNVAANIARVLIETLNSK